MEAYGHTALPAVAKIPVHREFCWELCQGRHPPNLAQLTNSLIDYVDEGGPWGFRKETVSQGPSNSAVSAVYFYAIHPPLPPLHINKTAVSMVESLKFLDTTISRDLKWEKNTISIIEKAQQRMFFLRQLKKFNLPQTLMIQFYTAIIESILTASITILFGSSTSQERTKLQRIIRTAERIIGCNLPSLQQIYTSRVRRVARVISYRRNWTLSQVGSSI
ncbi:hypothetical protein NFI96_002836 [Prochilodus magdalenae]|nr:hypothetical protein NFI96_002836 [Prochilodus magdalenae]